jgi:hypothetical protein
MKTYKKITLAAVTTAYAGYLIRQAAHRRADCLGRLAAGESIYERSHPMPRRTMPPGAHHRSRPWA